MYWYRIDIQLADGRRFTGYRPYPWKFKEAMTYFHSRQSTAWLGIERTGFSVFTVSEKEALQHGAPPTFTPVPLHNPPAASALQPRQDPADAAATAQQPA